MTNRSFMLVIDESMIAAIAQFCPNVKLVEINAVVTEQGLQLVGVVPPPSAEPVEETPTAPQDV